MLSNQLLLEFPSESVFLCLPIFLLFLGFLRVKIKVLSGSLGAELEVDALSVS